MITFEVPQSIYGMLYIYNRHNNYEYLILEEVDLTLNFFKSLGGFSYID